MQYQCSSFDFFSKNQCISTAGLTLSYRDYYHFPMSRMRSIEIIFGMNRLRKVLFANTWKSWQFMSREKYKSSYHLVSMSPLMDGLLDPNITLHASHRILLNFLIDSIYASLWAICETPFGDSVLPRQWNSFSSFYCVNSFLRACTSYTVHFQRVGRAQAEIHDAKYVVKFRHWKNLANCETARKFFFTWI